MRGWLYWHASGGEHALLNKAPHFHVGVEGAFKGGDRRAQGLLFGVTEPPHPRVEQPVVILRPA